MEKFSQPFEGSNTEPGKVAVAFYAGIFSYSGWLVYLKKKINNNIKLVNELLCGSLSFVILKLGAVMARVLSSVSLRRLLMNLSHITVCTQSVANISCSKTYLDHLCDS